MIRILIVDDHELVRTGFRMILSAQPDIEVVGEAPSGEDGVKLARSTKPEVVLMDLNLPGISGLEATERVLRYLPKCKVIVVTVRNDAPFPRRLLEAGAAGYISKACPATELLAAVRAVSNGQRYLSADIAHGMALATVGKNAESPFADLSARELEVALKIAEGNSMQLIADRLNLSVKTVATYKYRVYEKLDLDSEVALTHMAVRYGLI